jgi:hypothetical protein
MRRRTPAVEQPGFGEKECTGAHRGHAARPASQAMDRLDQGPIAQRCRGSVAARYDQGVEAAPHGPDAAIGAQCQAAHGRHRSLLGGGDGDVVVSRARHPVGCREHLDRAHDVERLDIRIGDDDHAASRHRPILRRDRRGGNDENPSIPARTGNPARQFVGAV